MLVQVRNRLDHMKNAKISVEGHEYQLDDNKMAFVDEQDALQLTGYNGTNWEIVGPTIEAPVIEEPKVVESVITKEEGPAVFRPIVAVYPNTPQVGEVWPEPTEDMDVEYLRQMAMWYDVKPHPAMKSKKLAAFILDAKSRKNKGE